jgi:hypothetical protein
MDNQEKSKTTDPEETDTATETEVEGRKSTPDSTTVPRDTSSTTVPRDDA